MPEHHQYELPNNHRIEEYEIIRVLGAGGFGITYLAFDHKLDGPVALKEYFYADLTIRRSDGKVVSGSADDDEGFHWGRDRFLDEAQVLERFDHPNIVRVHRYFEANNTAYIVMEYVEGEPLTTVLKTHGTLAPNQWWPWMAELLDGLEHVHRRDYLHRDIKPANIVIRANPGGEPQPVLIDFGSARRAAAYRTRYLTAVHTPGYAPIEQYSPASRQGPPADIYALSAVSYRVLMGEAPPDAADRVVEDAYRPLADRIGGADRAWLAGIDHGLGVRPNERPQTVAAWRARLTNALESAAERDRSGGAPIRRGGVPEDDGEAAAWYAEAAEQGDAEAQLQLGVMCSHGKGVPRDDAAAAKWFRRAAERGNAEAQFRLGVMYAGGRGVPRDDAAAAMWYHMAAEQGNVDAQFFLGRMHSSGRGVPKDDAAAIAWFRKATEQRARRSGRPVQSAWRRRGV